MEKKNIYGAAVRACCIGYASQAISADLAPLFFVIFSEKYEITIGRLAVLVLCGFGAQMCSDIFAGFFCERIGWRASGIIAHSFVFMGLILLGVLPALLPKNLMYSGILTAVSISQTGGGLIEVLVNPLMDELPLGKRTSQAKISFLHSFYSIGQVSVVLFTSLTLFFVHDRSWNIIPIVWAMLPLMNLVSFCVIPLPKMRRCSDCDALAADTSLGRRSLCLLLIMIACGGAAQQGMAQWISAYAESGLGIFKLAGDLLGPCIFAFLMGISRMVYGIFGDKIPIRKALIVSGCGSTICYIASACVQIPILSLIACSLTGLFVGLMCPGAFALASELYQGGGTRISGKLALFGDAGCAIGPWLVGTISSLANLNSGFLCAAVFPALFTIVGFIGMKERHRSKL